MELLREHHWPGNVRELRNLVESMVVLAPNRKIGPGDIPPEVRSGGRALVPVSIPRVEDVREAEGGLRTQLEFIFRTLVDLRVDMDELRREFEAYREELGMHAIPGRSPVEIRIPSPVEPPAAAGFAPVAAGGGGNGFGHAELEPGVVVYRPGMTMEELERAAIMAALREEGGNRRKAAEVLGIGERTLYRKIKQYGLEV
jgi:DNA-binding NtrC family response regulator